MHVAVFCLVKKASVDTREDVIVVSRIFADEYFDGWFDWWEVGGRFAMLPLSIKLKSSERWRKFYKAYNSIVDSQEIDRETLEKILSEVIEKFHPNMVSIVNSLIYRDSTSYYWRAQSIQSLVLVQSLDEIIYKELAKGGHISENAYEGGSYVFVEDMDKRISKDDVCRYWVTVVDGHF